MTLESFNFADVWEAVSDTVGDRVAVVCRDRSVTYAELESRSNRLAHVLQRLGVTEGDHVGVHLMNCIEYFEAMFACFKIRAVPININYRYVSAELDHLIADSQAVALISHRNLSDRLAGLASLAGLPILTVAPPLPDLELPDPIPGALDYELECAKESEVRDFAPRSDADRYVIYTGGTTGLPKGVVWTQQDAFFACIGGGDPMRLSGPVEAPAELLDRVIDFPFVSFPLAPMMHAAAQWTSLSWLFCGAQVVMNPGSFDALETWKAIEREKVSTLIVVGDAMVRPLVDAWDTHGPFDTSSMFALGSGGAPLTVSLKDRLAEILPHVMVTDGFGSSETGAQGSQRINPGENSGGSTRFVALTDSTMVLDENLNPVEPGSGVEGRVALRGRIPLGYFNDPEKSAATFVTVGDARWVLTGDIATVEADGTILLLGRGSQTINTGGEKVFPEEVEAAAKAHPAVYDAVVVGVPDDRFGQRVCAVVQLVEGSQLTLEDLGEHCRATLAGYKVPRELVMVDLLVRSPVGKPDYRWALETALAAQPDNAE